MAHGIILPETRDLATRLHARLEGKLRPVQNARFAAAEWIDFDHAGNVLLNNRPVTFLEWVWEILARLFTSKYERIDRELRVLTSEVNDYFTHENNPARRASFQMQFSRPIFEICRYAEKLARRGKVQEDIASVVIPAKLALQSVVIPDMHAESPHHRFHGFLMYGNEMEGANVRFGIKGGGEHELTGVSHLEREVLQTLEVRWADVKSSGAPLILFADVTTTHSVYVNPDVQIVLGRNGRPATSLCERIPNQKGVSFHNKADHTITISEVQDEQDDRSNLASAAPAVTLRPQEQRLFWMRCREKEKIIKLSFKTAFRAEIPLQIGCKLGRYFIKINKEGELVSTMTPLTINPACDRPLPGEPEFPRIDYIFQPQDSWTFVNERNQNFLITLQASNGQIESFFIRDHNTLSKTYAQLRQCFGTDWDGRLTTIPHYPKPINQLDLALVSETGKRV